MASISIFFGGKELETIELNQPEMVVGRDENTEIRIDNLGISRRHCLFSSKGSTHMVKDLGSSNGTFVNGKKVAELFLNNKDQIVLGKYMLLYKNTAQEGLGGEADLTEGNAEVPDSVNTFAMDGDKIRERIEQMREQHMAGKRPDTATADMPGEKGRTRVVTPASVSATQKHLAMYKIMFAFSLILNVILIILLINIMG